MRCFGKYFFAIAFVTIFSIPLCAASTDDSPRAGVEHGQEATLEEHLPSSQSPEKALLESFDATAFGDLVQAAPKGPAFTVASVRSIMPAVGCSTDVNSPMDSHFHSQKILDQNRTPNHASDCQTGTGVC